MCVCQCVSFRSIALAHALAIYFVSVFLLVLSCVDIHSALKDPWVEGYKSRAELRANSQQGTKVAPPSISSNSNCGQTRGFGDAETDRIARILGTKLDFWRSCQSDSDADN